MKKLILIAVAVLFLMPSIASAAWTITATVEQKLYWGNGRYIYRVKLACLSDGADPAEVLLSSYLTGNDRVYEGALLYQIETDPGVAPDAVWAVDFDTDLGADILDLAGLSVTATELHDVDAGVGFYPIVFDVGIDIGDIGSAADTVDIYLYFIK